MVAAAVWRVSAPGRTVAAPVLGAAAGTLGTGGVVLRPERVVAVPVSSGGEGAGVVGYGVGYCWSYQQDDWDEVFVVHEMLVVNQLIDS
jgi:hypothetical protein